MYFYSFVYHDYQKQVQELRKSPTHLFYPTYDVNIFLW